MNSVKGTSRFGVLGLCHTRCSNNLHGCKTVAQTAHTWGMAAFSFIMQSNSCTAGCLQQVQPCYFIWPLHTLHVRDRQCMMQQSECCRAQPCRTVDTLYLQDASMSSQGRNNKQVCRHGSLPVGRSSYKLGIRDRRQPCWGCQTVLQLLSTAERTWKTCGYCKACTPQTIQDQSRENE